MSKYFEKHKCLKYISKVKKERRENLWKIIPYAIGIFLLIYGINQCGTKNQSIEKNKLEQTIEQDTLNL